MTPLEAVDEQKLYYICSLCEYVKPIDPSDYKNFIVKTSHVNFRQLEDYAKYIPKGIIHDSTVPRDPNYICKACGKPGAVYILLPLKIFTQAMTMAYVCCHCEAFQLMDQ